MNLFSCNHNCSQCENNEICPPEIKDSTTKQFEENKETENTISKIVEECGFNLVKILALTQAIIADSTEQFHEVRKLVEQKIFPFMVQARELSIFKELSVTDQEKIKREDENTLDKITKRLISIVGNTPCEYEILGICEHCFARTKCKQRE